MITPQMMMDSIVKRLKEAFPDEPVYENLTPEEFDRPSNMVELDGITVLSSGAHVIHLAFQYRIVTFCKTDQLGDSHLPTLDLRAMTIIAAFSDGYLNVGDRAPKISGMKADTKSYDYAEVTFSLEFGVDRKDFRPQDILPLMEVVHINQRSEIK